jgi:hypothetical protein
VKGKIMPTVPMDIAWKPGWLTWVGATTRCLQALGVETDDVEVAGVSGYAFALSVNRGLCPSGPTCLDWMALGTGVSALGRTALCFNPCDCFTKDSRNERTLVHARTAFELATREVEAGRPCVVWGLGMPEFGVVRGVEDEAYLCLGGGPTPERLRWDELDAPGGPYFLGFPTANLVAKWRYRFAIGRAVDMMTRQSMWTGLVTGLPAYDAWAATLAARAAGLFGNSYNAQCWAEARAFAREYVGRVAQLHPRVAGLPEAHAALRDVSDAMAVVAELFPFTFDQGNVDDAQVISTARDRLGVARAAEERAIAALRTAIAAWPEEE